MRPRLAFAGVLLALLACERQSAIEGPLRVEAAPPADLGDAVERLRTGFREDAAAAVSGGPFHRVRVTRAGAQMRLAGVEGAPRVPLTLSTSAIGRPAREVVQVVPAIEGSGAVALRRPGSPVERWRNGESGVEQSFTFEAEPPGSGDLLVLVAASGLAFRGSTESGLHFGDASGGLRYGLATWVDATGRKTALPPPVFRDGTIALRVPEELLATSRYPAVLDPLVSPEIELDQPVFRGARGDQALPSVATDGEGYLAVWLDQRTGNGSAWAARVAAGGEILDPGGIELGAAKEAPAVGFDGTGYVVVWTENPSSSDGRLQGVRVSRQGLVSALQGLPRAGPEKRNAALACAAGTCLAVWREKTPGYAFWDVRGAFIAGGAAGEPFAICADAGDQINPAVAGSGSEFLVVWEDRRATQQIYGTRVKPDGTVLDPGSTLAPNLAASQEQPAVASDGERYLVVWTESASLGNDLVGIRWTRDGLAEGGRLTLVPFGGFQTEPAVSWDGQNFAFAFLDNSKDGNTHVGGGRVGPDGAIRYNHDVLSGKPYPVSQRSPAVACRPTGCLAVWTQHPGVGSEDVFAAKLGLTYADNSAEFLISRSANAQESPAIAHDGTNYLAVWSDWREWVGEYPALYGARIGPSGRALDEAGFLITDQTARAPAAAFNGANYLVVYQDDYPDARFDGVFAARVSPQGKVLDPGPIEVRKAGAWGEGCPAVAAGFGDWMVTWTDSRTAGPGLWGRRISGGGVLQGTAETAIASAFTGPGCPRVVWNGSAFLTAWTAPGAGPGDADVLAARVSSTGLLIDATPIKIAASLDLERAPALAQGPSNTLVAFSARSAGEPATWQIRGRRLAGGVQHDPAPLPLSTAAGEVTAATATHDGFNFLIVWEDRGRNLQAPDLWGARIAAAGPAIDPSGFPVSEGGQPEHAPALSSLGGGTSLLVYHRGDQAAGAHRLRARLISELPLGSPCRGPEECLSGFCADGVCCDTACGGGESDCLACSEAAGASSDGTCGRASAGAVCRPATGTCDVPETCSGTSDACPMDGWTEDGLTCDDGDLCSESSSCESGRCVGAAFKPCPPQECRSPGVCDAKTGDCVYEVAADASPCDDQNACTRGDACRAGVCEGSDPVVCSAVDLCHEAGACDAKTGLCSQPAKPDGTACDDDDRCTSGDRCFQGKCVPGSPRVCTAKDSCHARGVCDPETGACSEPVKADGESCSDGDACTRSDSCLAGRCVGADPVTCGAPGACQEPGTCQPATGKCAYPARPKGTRCDDGDLCTREDACDSGQCVGADPVVCQPLDACHARGTCDPRSGECSNPVEAQGTACDDGDACTLGDSCRNGICERGQPKSCEARACQEAAACAPATGECSYSPVADGAPCPGGKCQGGTCGPSPEGTPESGCGCATAGAGGSGAGLLACLALGLLRRRRESGEA